MTFTKNNNTGYTLLEYEEHLTEGQSEPDWVKDNLPERLWNQVYPEINCGYYELGGQQKAQAELSG